MPLLTVSEGSLSLTINADEGLVYASELVIDGLRLALGETPLVEILTPGAGAGSAGRYDGSMIGVRLRYAEHSVDETPRGRRLRVVLRDEMTGLRVVAGFELLAGADTIRSAVTVVNDSDAARTLLAVSSLALSSPDWSPESTRVHLAENDWLSEYRWRAATLRELGEPGILAEVHATHTPRGRFALSSTGTWSTGEHLPMGALENPGGVTVLWTVEHNGAWQWQTAETLTGMALVAGGPTEREGGWSLQLGPGEEFTTAEATLTVATDPAAAFGALTTYRRRTRQVEAGSDLPVVYNDYMNTLMADPSTEKLLPLIAAVGRTGAEYFCVDAGWYSDEPGWWSSVGAWEPSTVRFPNGIDEVFDAIRAAGMRPGIWLEPEVVGIDSPVAAELPNEAFFSRAGERVVIDGRFHLDLRHPIVVERLDRIVDGLIADHGIEFFKFDYNVSPATGTDIDATSPGDGALRVARATLDWIDGLNRRHPGLLIENCASGAMRLDGATMSRFTLASTSDQQDALAYAPIAAAAPTAITPEQAGVWCYPQPGISISEWTVAMAGGMLTRPYLSGHYDGMSDDEIGKVAAFVEAYRGIRGEIGSALPFWPLGLPGWDDDWIATGLRVANGDHLVTVWNRGADGTVELPIDGVAAGDAIETLLPFHVPGTEWGIPAEGLLRVALPSESAITVRIASRRI